MFLSSLTDRQKEAFFCLAHSVVISDGELSVGEQVMMEEMRREMVLRADFEPQYMSVEGTRQIFDTKRLRFIVLISLIRLGYADDAFEIEERSFLKLLCDEMEISNDDFALIENWVRRLIALEREANAFF